MKESINSIPNHKESSILHLEAKPNFKHTQWAQKFREQIVTGKLAPGTRLPSYRELSSRYQMSRATANRVFAALESEGLIDREAGVGVFVATPREQEQSTDTICAVCAGFGEDYQHPYYAQMIGAAHAYARQDNMRLLLCSGDSLPDFTKIAGILQITPHRTVIQSYVNQLPDYIPHVAVLTSCPGISSVIADEPQGVRDAVFHLTKLGHRRIAMLLSGNRTGPDRRGAYFSTVIDACDFVPPGEWLRIMPEPTHKMPFEEMGYCRMKEWIDDDWNKLGITALICQNDDAAAGVLRAATEAGIRVPDDLSLIGFDGTQIADFTTPRLTTVEMPLNAMMTRAWEMLRARSHPLKTERPEPETVMLPTKLRVAESTAPPKSN